MMFNALHGGCPTVMADLIVACGLIKLPKAFWVLIIVELSLINGCHRSCKATHNLFYEVLPLPVAWSWSWVGNYSA